MRVARSARILPIAIVSCVLLSSSAGFARDAKPAKRASVRFKFRVTKSPPLKLALLGDFLDLLLSGETGEGQEGEMVLREGSLVRLGTKEGVTRGMLATRIPNSSREPCPSA